jgi:hypothetical protein
MRPILEKEFKPIVQAFEGLKRGVEWVAKHTSLTLRAGAGWAMTTTLGGQEPGKPKLDIGGGLTVGASVSATIDVKIPLFDTPLRPHGDSAVGGSGSIGLLALGADLTLEDATGKLGLAFSAGVGKGTSEGHFLVTTPLVGGQRPQAR